MRGSGRVGALLAAVVVLAAACTFGGGSSNPTADVSPQSSPSSSTSNPATAVPPTTVSSPESSPSAAGLAITSLPVHNGEVGVIYLAVNFQATGGTAPYTWSVSDGTVPPGLGVSPGGFLTGNDSKAGTFSFTVKVTDSAGQSATGPVSMKVFPSLAVSQPCVNVCLVGFGCTSCGRFGSVSGGAGPYHYKVVGGVVPTGMTLNGFSLSGAWPVVLGVGNVDSIAIGPPRPLWSLSVSVTDDFNVTKTVSANWIEFGPIGMNCLVGIQCNSNCGTNGCVDTTITYSGGNPNDSVTVLVTQACYQDANAQTQCSPNASQVAAYLPPIWSATAKNDIVTVTAGCGNTCQSWVGDVTIVLVDHGACVAPAYVQSPSTIFNIDF